jgi:hypothetical protein
LSGEVWDFIRISCGFFEIPLGFLLDSPWQNGSEGLDEALSGVPAQFVGAPLRVSAKAW